MTLLNYLGNGRFISEDGWIAEVKVFVDRIGHLVALVRDYEEEWVEDLPYPLIRMVDGEPVFSNRWSYHWVEEIHVHDDGPETWELEECLDEVIVKHNLIGEVSNWMPPPQMTITPADEDFLRKLAALDDDEEPKANWRQGGF